MKPIRLTIENFGPFLKENIDFTQIETNQLFLISGKTGSGKTMIFDAIVYALYGRASTTAREVAQLRSHFAPPEEPLKVIYEFDMHHQRYKVIRSASFTKPNKKSETPGILEVYKLEDDHFVLQESKINAGNAYLQSLMNLKVDQFRQLFILPQGEFKSFLVSKSQDKQTILRTLFNTVMYEDLKNTLKEKTKSIQDDMDKTYDRLRTCWQDMYALDNETLKHYLETDVSQYAQIETYLSEFNMIGLQEVSQLSSEKEKIEQQMKHVQTQIDQETMRQQLCSELKEVEHQRLSLKEQSDEIKQLEQKLHILKESQLAIHALTELEQLQQDMNDNKEKLAVLDNQMKAYQQELNTYHQKSDQLEAKQTDMDTKLETLKTTHHYIQHEKDIIQAFEDETALLKQNENLNHILEKVRAQLEQIRAELDTLATDFSKLDEYKETQFSLRRELDKIDGIEQQYKRKCELDKQRHELTASLTASEQHIEQLASQKHEITESAQSMASHDDMIQTLRATLSISEPCPVCGQIVHDTNAGEDMELVKKHLEENEQIEAKVRQIATSMIEQQTTLKHIDIQLKELESIEDPEHQKQACLKQKAHNASLIKELTAKQQQVENLNDKKQRLEENAQQLKSDITKNNYAHDHAKQKVMQFKQTTQFDDFYTFKTAYEKLEKEVNAFQKERDELKTNIQTVNEQLMIIKNDIKHQDAQHQSNQKRYAKVDAIVQEEMRKLNVDSLAQLRQLTTEAEHIEAYQTRIETFHKDMQKWTTQRDTLSQKLKGLPENNLQALQLESEHIQNALNTVTKQYNETAFQVQENKKKIQKIEEIIQYIQQSLTQHRAIFNLSEVISGKNNLKLTLENYVLIYYLEHILDAANKRLRHMTGQRYELVRKIDKGRGYSGLEIEVFDYYSNQARHITSLSGGETFQASLALALGLSEIVQNEQGGISLDAMFIDEGFGTLDQETLETALDTLIQLQATGRLVGIISHVTELKNRIPTILEVNAKNYQSSTSLTFNE